MPDNTITLDLTGIAHGGSAIGRFEGRAIFVPYGIPGERVEVRIVQDKGRFAIAEIVEVLQASPDRVEAPCPHFGPRKCGGCQFQMIDYTKQIELKAQIVREQLARLGGLPDVVVHPTVPSPSSYYYRSHATFHVTYNGKLGFVSTNHRSILPIDECLLLAPALQPEFEGAKNESFVPGTRVRFQAGTDAEAIYFEMGGVTDDVAEALPEQTTRNNPRQNKQRPAPPVEIELPEDQGSVEYRLLDRSFRCSSGSFFQVNVPQAAKLVELVLERLNLQGNEHVLDLYSGVGLFTAFIAAGAAHVSAVELFAPAVDDAVYNLSDYSNIDLYVDKIEAALPEIQRAVNAAVVDPPRAGMDAAALDALVTCNPHQIVYVSCDPATLARDAKRLVAAGYTLQDVQPVDMFPQTYHIECVAHFTR